MLLPPPVVALVVTLELLLLPPPITHWPALQLSPVGQTTPSQGELPQAPVAGSQYEPLVHGFVWQ